MFDNKPISILPMYSSAFPQGSSVLQNKATTVGIWMSTQNPCRKQLFPLVHMQMYECEIMRAALWNKDREQQSQSGPQQSFCSELFFSELKSGRKKKVLLIFSVVRITHLRKILLFSPFFSFLSFSPKIHTEKYIYIKAQRQKTQTRFF